MNSDELADLIQQRADDLGWSQMKLADEAGISSETVNRIMTGKGNPRLSTLRKLDETLNLGILDGD